MKYQITEDNVKWFFQNMKDRGSLPQSADLYFWSFDDEVRGENIYFRYYVGGDKKTFGYKIPIESVIEFIREWKLKQIINF
jgi:hypothetical protein